MKPKMRLLVVVGCLAAAMAVGGWLLSRQPAAESPSPSSTLPGPAAGVAAALQKSGFEIVEVRMEPSSPPPAPDPAADESLLIPITDPTLPRGLVPEAPEAMQLVNPAFDPEQQPRGFWMEDFRGAGSPPADIRLEGVVMTARGIELAPDAPRDKEGARRGTIESSGVAMEFPFNNMSPLWMEEVPPGTTVRVEASASPDGVAWTPWESAVIGEEQVSPTYPDGRPNPNFGFQPGGILLSGEGLYTHLRYRITLVSATGESPAVGAIRFYIQDNTLGEGRLATIHPAPASGTTN